MPRSIRNAREYNFVPGFYFGGVGAPGHKGFAVGPNQGLCSGEPVFQGSNKAGIISNKVAQSVEVGLGGKEREG